MLEDNVLPLEYGETLMRDYVDRVVEQRAYDEDVKIMGELGWGGYVVPVWLSEKIARLGLGEQDPDQTLHVGILLWSAQYISQTGHEFQIPLLATDFTFLGAVYEAERIRQTSMPRARLISVVGVRLRDD